MAKAKKYILQMQTSVNANWINCDNFNDDHKAKAVGDRVQEANQMADELGLGVKFRVIEAGQSTEVTKTATE